MLLYDAVQCHLLLSLSDLIFPLFDYTIILLTQIFHKITYYLDLNTEAISHLLLGPYFLRS